MRAPLPVTRVPRSAARQFAETSARLRMIFVEPDPHAERFAERPVIEHLLRHITRERPEFDWLHRPAWRSRPARLPLPALWPARGLRHDELPISVTLLTRPRIVSASQEG